MRNILVYLAAIAAASLTACSASPEDGENAESGNDALLAGTRLTPAQIATMLRDEGFDEADIGKLVCTAKYESSYYTGAQNHNTNGSTDYGLFQINDRYWLRPCGVTRQQLLDAKTNVKCAKMVFDQQGIGAWYGYKAHRTECNGFTVQGGGGDTVGQPGEGCYSTTLKARVQQGECVQSASNSVWYQCYEGTWYRTSAQSGPAGACTDEHPLE